MERVYHVLKDFDTVCHMLLFCMNLTCCFGFLLGVTFVSLAFLLESDQQLLIAGDTLELQFF